MIEHILIMNSATTAIVLVPQNMTAPKQVDNNLSLLTEFL